MLDVENLETGYGSRKVLHGVSLQVARGEIVAVVGPNGSGKSTLLKAIIGVVPVWHGCVRIQGQDLNEVPPAKRVVQGVSYVPQGHRVFTELTVDDNLEIAASTVDGKRERAARKDEVFECFPPLAGRRRRLAGTLSGGERQMLALAMGFVPQPKIMVLDEPSSGLTDSLMEMVLEKLSEFNADHHTALLIVEQRVRDALRIAGTAYVLRRGRVLASGLPSELMEGSTLKDLFLG